MSQLMAYGIYCYEGDWGSARDRRTVEPVLTLLSDCEGNPYIHRHVATEEALTVCAQKWIHQHHARALP